MSISTRESLSGYICSDPQLNTTREGKGRFYARVRQDHFHREEDGTYTKLSPTYTDLVIFGKTAERAHITLRKGDAFIAEGRTHLYTTDKDGTPGQREQFIATRIGHDTILTRYQVDRTPRVERKSPLEQALTPPPHEPPRPTAHELAR